MSEGNESHLWVDRETAKQAHGMTEEQFANAVRKGEILFHRGSRYSGGPTLYFIGVPVPVSKGEGSQR